MPPPDFWLDPSFVDSESILRQTVVFHRFLADTYPPLFQIEKESGIMSVKIGRKSEKGKPSIKKIRGSFFPPENKNITKQSNSTKGKKNKNNLGRTHSYQLLWGA